MGQRRNRLNKRIATQIATRQKNSIAKSAERIRRETQMLTLIKKSDPPYPPGVMSWLSLRLGKKASQITNADIKAL